MLSPLDVVHMRCRSGPLAPKMSAEPKPSTPNQNPLCTSCLSCQPYRKAMPFGTRLC